MAVNVDYTEELGYVTREGSNTKTYLHSANCLFAEIHHFLDGEGEKCSCLISFAADLVHLRAQMRLYPGDLKKCTYHLNTYYKLWRKIGGLLTKFGMAVELYYKEPQDDISYLYT